MSHVKRAILSMIVFSNIGLLAVFLFLLNYLLPKHFEKEAKETLIHEMNFLTAVSETEEETISVPYEGTYLSDNITYLYPKEKQEDSYAYFQSSQKIRFTMDEVIKHYELANLKDGEIDTYKTSSGYYIMVPLKTESFEEEGTLEQMLLYINIKPFLSFVASINWILLGFFFCETIVMCKIGWNLGVKIEHSREAQRKFFQNTSHELKTPLMSIQGYAEGIHTGIGDAVQSSKVIMQETDTMAKLVDELLTISKIDANQFTLHKMPIDARELLYDCMMDLEAFASMNHIQMEPQFGDDAVMVECDEKQLERAIRNILTNAIRHGKNRIIITCEAKDRMGKIEIADDGAGLSDTDLTHIFERFYSGSGGSTGIGLALAYEIIKLHHGDIKVSNRNGAVFSIYLPQSR